MANVIIAPPPGVVKRGTNYLAKGRWSDSNLWRWRAGAMKPVGGWQPRSTNPITGPGRTILAWRDSSNNSWIGVGSPTGLFIQDRGGNVYNVTPSSFTAGRSDATTGGGYGGGNYGAGAYGQPTPDVTQVLDATMWTLDLIGPYLVGVSPDDGNLMEWQLVTGTPAAKIANSPPCSACFVTNEHMVMALGANNDPRQVAWSDQSNNTVWTASNTNTAGEYELTTQGRLMCGKRVQGANLLWTDCDLWLATNLANLLVYGFTKVGDGCGIISRGAAVVVGLTAVWMGQNGFWVYNGFTTLPLECDVLDGVFSNLNQLQQSKVVAFYNGQFDEVWWFYPSSASTEIDSYVSWSVHENHWATGKLERFSACDRGIYSTPLMVDANGLINEHEVGLNWGGELPYATLSSFEIGSGDQTFFARQMIPDDAVVGQISATFNARFYPDDPSIIYGPYTLSPRTDIRFTGREVDMTLTATGPYDFRVGNVRLEGVLGSER